MSKTKLETIEEFLARGGKIQTVPPQEIQEQKSTISVSYSASPLELDEGALYYAEPNKNSNKYNKVKPEGRKADPDKIPEHLRKYL